MADVRSRLNSHPVPTLRKILSAVAKDINIKGGFSRTLKTKKELVDYMIKLEKDMAEVSWDKIPLREKPKKSKAPPKPKKEKAPEPKKATPQEIKDSLMVAGKYTPAEIKAGKALVKNQPKAKPKVPPISKVVKSLKEVKTLNELEQLFNEIEKIGLQYTEKQIDKIKKTYETKKNDLMKKPKQKTKKKHLI